MRIAASAWGILAMTAFLSFRGAKRRGNPFPSQESPVPRSFGKECGSPVTGREEQGALSEAGSAGIVAGQFGFCPITSEYSVAHNVRKSDRHSARGYVGGCLN